MRKLFSFLILMAIGVVFVGNMAQSPNPGMSTVYPKNFMGPCTPGVPCNATITPLVVSGTITANQPSAIQTAVIAQATAVAAQATAQGTPNAIAAAQATVVSAQLTVVSAGTTIVSLPTNTPVATATATPIIGMFAQRSFTSLQSTTPTPIATAISSTYTHVKLFFNNTGTAGDFVTVYMGANAGVNVYLAPSGGIVTKDFWATASNAPISIGGGNTASATITSWGYYDQQTYQVPVNLPTQ